MKIDRDTTSRILTSVVAKLALVNNLSELTQVVAEAARALTCADGTSFVLREGDHCFYADESAIAALWKGKRFPLEACISGWSMLHREVVVIKDIYSDSRVPHEAYRPTFVKSLCMVPIRRDKPVGAIGSYWAKEYEPTEKEIYALQVLADTTSVALENLDLKKAMSRYTTTLQKSFTKGPFLVDTASQRVSLCRENGKREVLNLTPTEARLLIHFMQHEGEIFSRDQLVKTIWGNSTHVSGHTVDTHISSMRKKIGGAAKYIRSVPREGFCFRADQV